MWSPPSVSVRHTTTVCTARGVWCGFSAFHKFDSECEGTKLYYSPVHNWTGHSTGTATVVGALTIFTAQAPAESHELWAWAVNNVGETALPGEYKRWNQPEGWKAYKKEQRMPALPIFSWGWASPLFYYGNREQCVTYVVSATLILRVVIIFISTSLGQPAPSLPSCAGMRHELSPDTSQ